MVIQVLHCPHCQSTDIVRHGTTRHGKQRYRCRTCPEHGRTLLLEYAYAGQSPEIKRQIVDMAVNASGIRATARVLHVSPSTVIKELKKKNRTSSRCIGQCDSICIPKTWRASSGALTSWPSVAG
jgi:transposase-like protein